MALVNKENHHHVAISEKGEITGSISVTHCNLCPGCGHTTTGSEASVRSEALPLSTH